MSPRLEGALALLTVPAVLFAALLLTIEVAYVITRHRVPSQTPRTTASAVAGAAFTLLALVLAFAYSDADQRLDEHRQLAVEEANAIDGVWLRLDLLHEPEESEAKALLRAYADARIAAQDALPDVQAFEQERADAADLHHQLWDVVVGATEADPGLEKVLLLPPLLTLSDIATIRTLTVRTHLSTPAFGAMFLLAFVCAALVGITTAQGEKRNWPYRVVVAAGISVCIYVVIDMEYPRSGIDQAFEADATLVDLRRAMS